MTGPNKLPFDEPPVVGPQATRHIFTVTQLTAEIRTMMESTYPELWVEGEISNARLWKTGHLYFTLKDIGAQLNAVMFRSTVRYLRFKPENGQHVLARGRLSLYDPKGEYQMVCEYMEPRGLGALHAVDASLLFHKCRRECQLTFCRARHALLHEALYLRPVLAQLHEGIPPEHRVFETALDECELLRR